MKIGISGAGYIVPFHICGWRAAGAEVVALADPDAERASRCARKFGIPSTYRDVSTMLAAGGIDVLDVASPRQVHVQQAIMGLEAGLAVMTQKPVAPTLAEAEQLADRIGPGDRLMVHENWRFRPQYRQIRIWIDEGRLGSLRFAAINMRTTSMLRDASGTRPAQRRQPFMMAEQRLLIAEVLIHDIDALRFLVGDLKLVDAFGARGDVEVVGETSATLFLTTDDGVPAIVSGDMLAYGAPAGAADWGELIGSQGRIVLEHDRLACFSTDGEEVLDFSGRDLLAECAAATIRHFVDCLRSGREFETAITDNLKTLVIVEQAYERLNNGVETAETCRKGARPL